MLSIRINPLITVTVLGRMNQRQGWDHNGKVHEENVLVIVVKGACVFEWEDNRCELSTGEAVIIPAKTLYRAHTDMECDYYFFHFRTTEPIQQMPDTALPVFNSPIISISDMTFDIREQPGLDPGIVYAQSKTALLENYDDALFLISKCLNRVTNLGRFDSPFIRLYFTEILLLMDLQLRQQLTTSYPVPLTNMVSFINQNYTLPISLQNLSDTFQLSKQYIARLFIRHLRVTANTYIHMVKLHHAQELLKFSRMNIAEISNYLGFCSTSYFSRVFKQHYAVSPKQYQNSTNALLRIIGKAPDSLDGGTDG